MLLSVLFASVLLVDDAQQQLVHLLGRGATPSAAVAALDEHVAFDRALAEVLDDPTLDAARRDAVARQALAISPVLVPRTFTDGRAPTGWDLAYRSVLAQRRAGGNALAERIAEVERHLDPEIWQPREGLAALQALGPHASDELVALTVFRAADRLAPFRRYRAELEGAVEAALAPHTEGLARHAVTLAHLRLAVDGGEGSFTPRDAALWFDAERWAPTPTAAHLTALAGLHDRWRRGPTSERAAVRRELARRATAADAGEAVRSKAPELLARLCALDGDVPTALVWVDALAAHGAPPEQTSAILALLTQLVADRLAPADAEDRAALREMLARAADAVGEAPMRAAVEWSLAQLAALDEDHDAEQEHLVRASALALTGAEPPPEEEYMTSWWTPLPPPALAEIEPVETSRLASWWVAERAFDAGAWSVALRHYRPDVPLEGCGNHIEDVVTHRRLRISRCYEELGRVDEARDLLRHAFRLVQTPAASTEALVALVEFEVRHDGDATLDVWLEGLVARPEKLAKARVFLDWASAAARGDLPVARAAAEAIVLRWPDDALLVARVASLLGD